MRKLRVFCPLLVVLLIVCFTGASQDALPVGEIIEQVKCQKDPEISYALYLPSQYSDTLKWPVIWSFSPFANGVKPVNLLKDAAEQYGYILIGSNDSRNGPWEPTDKAMDAMWRDVGSRFSVNGKRHYGAGFSGGARAALDYAIERQFAGVILCGAVYSTRRELPNIGTFAVFGIVGDGDLAFAEHLQAEEVMKERGYQQWLEVFVGAHDWPPSELMREGVEFFQIGAMKKKQIARDKVFLKSLLSRRLESADALLKSGRPLLAARKLRQTGGMLAGVKGAEEAARRASEMVEEFSQVEAEENRYLQELTALLSPADPKALRQAVVDLQKRRQADDQFALRATNALFLRVLFLTPSAMAFLNQGDLEKAKIVFHAATGIFPDHPNSAYNAACISARQGDALSALAFLRNAAENHFNDIELLRSDSDLDSLRKLDEFADVVEMVQDNVDQGLEPPSYPITN